MTIKVHTIKCKYIFLLILIIGITGICISGLSKVLYASNWWQIPGQGEIHLSPIVTRDRILWVTNLGEVYSANKLTGSILWKYQLPARDTYSFSLLHDRLILVMPQGVLVVLSADTGQELWKFSTNNQTNLSGYYQLKFGNIYINSADASVYAINFQNGLLAWQFKSKTTETNGTYEVSGKVNRFGKLEYYKNHLIYASPDKHVYALQPLTGKVDWDAEIGSFPSAMQLQRGVLYVGFLDGRIVGVDFYTGKRLFETSVNTQEILCFRDVSLTQGWKSWPSIATIKHAYRFPLLAATKDGTIFAISSKLDDFDIIASLNTKLFSCPQLNHNQGYLFLENGEADRIDIHRKTTSQMFSTGGYNFFEPVLLNSGIIATSNGGGMSNFNFVNGQPGWSYDSMGQIVSRPVADGKYLYFSDTDGRISRIDKTNGVIPMALSGSKLKITNEVKNLNNSKFYEFTLHFDETKYPNPWSQIKISAQFTHQTLDKPIQVDGYYYDSDTWKVRFNPPLKGEWVYAIDLILPNGKKLSNSGTFVSDTDTSKLYLRASKEYPNKFTLDGTSEFFPIGIQDSVGDSNRDGSTLDDWFLSEPSSQSATFTSLSTYLNEYGKSGSRFNMYRFGVNNASFGLFDRLYVGAQLSIQNAKSLDVLFQALRDNSYHVWMSLFSFYINEKPFTIEKEFLDKYVRYVIARYGVYVDIWEIGNETHSSDELVTYYANLIRSADFEKRLITTNWEKPKLNSIDIVSLHRYESDPSWKADLTLLSLTNTYNHLPKPVVFSEIGNRTSSSDIDSLNRMRVKSWTGFFNDISLIFWNTSSSKNYYNAITQNGNIYIGPEEREQISVLNSFTQNLPLESSRTKLFTSSSYVRGYGIDTTDRLLGYFVCEYPTVSFALNRFMPRGGVVAWINPKTGEQLASARFESGTKLLISPPCQLDLAMRINFNL